MKAYSKIEYDDCGCISYVDDNGWWHNLDGFNKDDGISIEEYYPFMVDPFREPFYFKVGNKIEIDQTVIIVQYNRFVSIQELLKEYNMNILKSKLGL